MRKILSTILFCIIWAISLLPLRVLYLFADLVWLIMFICPPLRYRRRIVQNNLALSFPEKDGSWLKRTERRFYFQFLSQIMESLKMASMGPGWMKRHIEFNGIDALNAELDKGRSQVLYLGHTGNWEWIASIPLHLHPDKAMGCQVYHVLENHVMDSLMLKMRGRYGAVSIPMEHIARRLIEYRRSGQTFVVGMIADQVPLWWNIHYWTRFMNRKTPVFTGSETLSRKLGLGTWYLHVSRPRRGRYCCEFVPMFSETAGLDEFAVTERYMRLLEDNIKECPELWLWTHNRWKRTWEGYQDWLKSCKSNRRDSERE